MHGKDVLPPAGEYTGELMLDGVSKFLAAEWPEGRNTPWTTMSDDIRSAKRDAASGLGKPVPVRPPGFCVGCPERPVFSAIKIAEREIGKTHVTADVGCHIFATLPPFNLGNTMLGYGLGLASSSGIAANFKRRVISIMGDGGFWHNGLTTGVTSALANGGDSILIIMKNGYAAATGGQKIPSSADGLKQQGEPSRIDAVLKSVGVKWLKTIRSYSVDTMPQGDRGSEDHTAARTEGDHRRRRVPAGAAAAHPAADRQAAEPGQAGGAHPLRHRPGHVHR